MLGCLSEISLLIHFGGRTGLNMTAVWLTSKKEYSKKEKQVMRRVVLIKTIAIKMRRRVKMEETFFYRQNWQ